jgi:hypothetical protein
LQAAYGNHGDLPTNCIVSAAFPKPTRDDLDALLPGLLQTIATERGVNARWITPIDAAEHATRQ